MQAPLQRRGYEIGGDPDGHVGTKSKAAIADFQQRAGLEVNGRPSVKTADTLRLANVDIECRPASYRTVRGATAVGLIADETAFWWTAEAARNPSSLRRHLNEARV